MDNPSSNRSWGKFSEATEADLPEYRALSGIAVIGFILGVLSFLAIVHIGMSFIGAAAALCCVAALARIAAAPSEVSGRRLAIAGIALALFWTAAGLAREATRQRLFDVHSRQFAVHWFDYLKSGEFEKACALGLHAASRPALNEKLMDHYLTSKTAYEELQSFAGRPEVRCLIHLGDRAQVRHYAFKGAGPENATQIFAVTYDDQGTKKSFLVRLFLTRSKLPADGRYAWHVNSSEAPWKPDLAS